MANWKISQLDAYPNASLGASDIMEVSYWNGANFESKKVSRAQLIATFGGASSNLGNSDLTSTANTRKFTLNGSLSSNVLDIVNGSSSLVLRMQGNHSVYSHGSAYTNATTAYGLNALVNNSSGAGCTAFGNDALKANTSGGTNSAFGFLSSTKIQGGGNNSSFGAYALAENVSGINNTSVGFFSLNLATGSKNTALGHAALYGITSGSNNLQVGYQTGVTGITTGSNNTLVGGEFTGLASNLQNNVIIADGQANQLIRKDANHNQILGIESALATTATNGFTYIPTCAGTPTGTPTAITGKVPIVADTTNNKLYVYLGGAWVAMN